MKLSKVFLKETVIGMSVILFALLVVLIAGPQDGLTGHAVYEECQNCTSVNSLEMKYLGEAEDEVAYVYSMQGVDEYTIDEDGMFTVVDVYDEMIVSVGDVNETINASCGSSLESGDEFGELVIESVDTGVEEVCELIEIPDENETNETVGLNVTLNETIVNETINETFVNETINETVNETVEINVTINETNQTVEVNVTVNETNQTINETAEENTTDDYGSFSYCLDKDNDGYYVTNTSACETFIVVENDGNVIAPAGFMEVKVMAAEITYGATGPEIDVYVKLIEDGDYTTLFGGVDVDGNEAYNKTLTSETEIAIEGRAKYGRRFDRTYRSDTGSDHVEVLMDGDDLPDYAPFGNQDSLSTIIAPFVDENNKIDIDVNQVLFLFEFATLNTDAADFQDLVVLLTFEPDDFPCECGEFDCDENDPNINPGAAEICDGIDNDCDFFADEEFDDDGDGFTVCGGDCNDNDVNINPNATEICNFLDDDCDGEIDEGFDLDNDGFTTCGGDCDDNNSEVNPDATEICDDEIDNDCNGDVDFEDDECANILPTASIISPLSGSNFKLNEQIVFSGIGTDSDGTVVSYSWASNVDGTFGSNGTVTHSGLSIGTHVITLTVTDDRGGQTTDTVTITILALNSPTASIISPADGSDFKHTNEITFSGLGDDTDGTIVGYSWESNVDGVLNDSSLFTTNALSVGIHTITFTVEDDDGLTDVDEITITVKELEAPTASILSPNDGDDFKDGDNVLFSGTGSDTDGSVVSYQWSSSIDGLIGNTTSFSTTDLTVGLHEIVLVVVDDDGLNDTDSIEIEVKALRAPTASIISPNDGDHYKEADNILFSGTGSDPDGYITKWYWSSSVDGLFKEQTGGNASTFFYDSLSLGTHDITLTVVDNDGLQYVDTFTVTIDVNPLFAPTASIITPLDGVVFREGEVIVFSGYGDDINGNVTDYDWVSSLDGSIGSDMTFTHSSLSLGEHDITLIVTDDDGQTGDDTITITIIDNDSPTASITSPTDGDSYKEGHTILFNGYGDNETIVGYSWASNLDGVIGNSSTFSLDSLTVGEHVITFTVLDDDGQTGSDSITINVNALEAPTVSIIAPLDGSDYKHTQPVYFEGVGTDTDGTIESYHWTSDVDGVIGNSSSFITSTLSTGLHTVTLTVIDSDGLVGTDEIELTIKVLEAPTVSILSPDDGDNFKENDSILFSGIGTDADGVITQWYWSSSIDGLMHEQTGGSASTFYYHSLSLGTHLITVTVIDDDGLQYVDTFTVTIDVNPEFAPTASIISPLDGVVFRDNDLIVFSGLGDDVNGVVESYHWVSSVDGTLGDSMTFNSTALSVGTHDITLTVTDDDGQTGDDTISITVLDNDMPTASIMAPTDNDNFKDGQTILFSGLGGDEVITGYAWSSNIDGLIGNLSSFSTSDLSLGEHIITFRVFDDDGQSGSDSITITINPLVAPTASIVSPLDGTDYKDGQTVLFSGVGTDTDGVISSYYWSSSIDGVIGNSSSFSSSNLSVGLHTITFRVVDDDSLISTDTIEITIKALEAPTASILSPNDGDHYKENDSILFSGTGSDPDGAIVKWTWSSSIDGLIKEQNGGTSSTFFYNGLSLGTHDITLTVVDDDGLKYVDTFTVTVDVNPLFAPTASIISPLGGTVFRDDDLIVFSGYGDDVNGVVEGYSWVSSLDGTIGNNMTFTTDLLSQGVHTVTLTVTDDDGQTGDDTIQITVLDNDSPTASITSPNDNDNFKEGQEILFSGYGDNEVITSYTWTSNLDGVIGSGATFSTTNLTVGEHEITLTVLDDDGQTGFDTITITVNALEAPTVSIIAPLDGADYKYTYPVYFEGVGSDSDGVVVNYQWTSDIDGVIGNTSSFITDELSLGLHTITLTIVDDDGLIATDEIEVTIKPLTAPSVSILSPDEGDHFKENDSILFSGIGTDSDGIITQWYWSSSIDGLFHEQTGGSASTFYHNELSLGTHLITVTIIDDDGLQYVDTFTVTIDLNPEFAPTTSIISPLDGSTFRSGDNVLYSGYGDDINGYITDYYWTSDIDGVIGNEMTFSYSNLTVGLHTITLTVTDDDGQTGDDSITVTVLDNDVPTSSIVSPGEGDNFKDGQSILFSGVGDNEVITGYEWVSNIDGGLGNSSTFSTSILSLGEHTITFRVFDDDGQSNSDSIMITINPLVAPTASIISPIDGTDYKDGQTVLFNGIGSDTDGLIASYYWSSDVDGVIGNTSSFSSNNLSVGLHTITFRAVDEDGLMASDSVDITIKALEAPTASIINPNDGDHYKENDSILFSGIGSDPDGAIVKWYWSSSIDGLFHEQTGGLASTFYYNSLSLGTHLITLTVVDDDEIKYVDTFTVTIDVNPLFAPTASILSPVEGTVFRDGDRVLFSGYGDDINGVVESYYWTSDKEGVLGNTMTFNVSTLSVGVHEITLTVTDDDGQTGDDSIVITVLDNDSPTASITSPADGDNFKEGQNIFFTGLGDNEVISSYTWVSSLDGSLSSSQSFTYSELTIGEHVITLTVTDDDGQSASDSITVTINPLVAPVASIISPVDQADYKENQFVMFNGVGSDSDGSIVDYYWTSDVEGVVGNGNMFSTDELSIGYHTITLTVVDNDGLIGTDELEITIKPLTAPTASIVKPDTGDHFKEQTPVEFIGSGSDPDGEIIEWIWTSDVDGEFGSSQRFNYSELSLGRHDVTLTVVDDDALRYTDTFTIWIEIDPLRSPNVTITTPQDKITVKEDVVVVFDANVTYDPVSTGSSYYWVSDIDGMLDEGTGVPVLFSTDELSIGYHTITLTTIDSRNLSGSDTVHLWIAPLLSPEVNISSPPNNSTYWEGDSINFSALITDDGTIQSILWNSDLDGNIGNSSNFTYSGLTVGEHRITLIVVDDDNLTTVTQITVLIKKKESGGGDDDDDEDGGGSGGSGGLGGIPKPVEIEEPEELEEGLQIKIVESPSGLNIEEGKFVIVAEIINNGDTVLKDINAELEKIDGWKSNTVYIGELAVDERVIVTFEVESEICALGKEVGQIDRELEIVAVAENEAVSDTDKVMVDVEAETFAVLNDVIDNQIKVCFIIDNKGNDERNKVEIEIGVYEEEIAVLLDYITNIDVESDEIFIKTKEYELSYIPETKSYTLRADLYEKGKLFSSEYKIADSETQVELQKTGKSLWEQMFS